MIRSPFEGLTVVDTPTEAMELFRRLKINGGGKLALALQKGSEEVLDALCRGRTPESLSVEIGLINHLRSVWAENELLRRGMFQCHRCNEWHEGRGRLVLYPKNFFFGYGEFLDGGRGRENERGNVTVPEISTARLCSRCVGIEKVKGGMPLSHQSVSGIHHRSMPNYWSAKTVRKVTEVVSGLFPPTIEHFSCLLLPPPYFRLRIGG